MFRFIMILLLPILDMGIFNLKTAENQLICCCWYLREYQQHAIFMYRGLK